MNSWYFLYVVLGQATAPVSNDNTAIFIMVPSLIAFLGVGLGVLATIRSGNQKAQTDFTAQLQLQVNRQDEQLVALESRVTTAEENERQCQNNLNQTRSDLQEAQRQLSKVEWELKRIKGTA